MNASLAGLVIGPVAFGAVALLAGCGSLPVSASPEKAPPAQAVAAAQPANPQPTAPRAEQVWAPLSAGLQRVTFTDDGADFDPSVSRDGQTIVFASTAHSTRSDIFIKRVDARVVTQLTNDPADDAMPTLSPDGKHIAFASNRAGNWDIYVMSVTGGRPVQVTFDTTDEVQPSWSPDGTRLAFSRLAPTGRWEIWSANLENPDAATFLSHGMRPRWNPAAARGGDQLLFQQARGRGNRAFGIWTLDLRDGAVSNVTQIASTSDAALINPAWSPDGEWIVYASVPLGENGEAQTTGRLARGSLWMTRADGGGQTQISAGDCLSPEWASGDRLLFVSSRTGADNVWMLDVRQALAAATALRATSQTEQLATTPSTPTTTPTTTPARATGARASVPPTGE
jgi:TolB protein